MKKFLSIMTLALLSASFAGCAGGSQNTLIPQAQSQGARADQIGLPPPTIVTVGSHRAPCPNCVGVPTTGDSDGVGTSAQNPGGCPMAISHREKANCHGGGGSDVAEVPGKPSGPCAQTDGSNSLPVGATVGDVNKNGTLQVRSVVDINQVNGIASQTIENNQTVATSLYPIGWIYLDNQGGEWFQRDPAAQWSASVAINVNAVFGIGLTPPNPQIPVPVKKPTSNPSNNGVVTQKYFSGGSALAPGTIG